MLKNLNFFGELNLGLILTAVGIVYFKNPNHFAFGGTSGLSILLADLFPKINVGGFMWIINLILVVLGFVFLGIKTMGWTIYSSFALSFFVSVCEWLYPVNVSMSGDAMLDLVFAVFLPALGAAIVFDIGASTGGTDIVALILAKYTSMEIGKALMVSDILIVLAAAWRFGMGTGLYCILGLIVLGFVFLGIKTMGWTIYSSFALSFFVSVCEWLYPVNVSMSGDAMLDLVFAVFLPALGAAIVFDIGASTGGTDIVALILAKYTSMEIGKALMVSDILIVLAAAWRFGMGTGLYCILGLIGKSFVVDGAIENIRLRKVCTIVTSNPQPILDFIIKEMNRSATVEKAYGAYTHHELSVLVTVLTRRQALQLRNFLRENDPRSFITIVNSSEIIGKGFRSFN